MANKVLHVDGDGTSGQVLLSGGVGAPITWGTIVGSGDLWSDPVDSHVVPDADGTRNLGATATRFNAGYFDYVYVTNDISFVSGSINGLVSLEVNNEIQCDSYASSSYLAWINFPNAGDLNLSPAAGKEATVSGQKIIDETDIGTLVQAYDAELAAIAGLTSAADRGIYFTGSGTASLFTLTSAGRSLIDDASAAAQRTTLGVGTTDSPQFTAVNIGHATDTTVSRVSAGVIAVEGVTVPTVSSTSTFTNKTLISTTNVISENTTVASSATPTPTGGSLRNFFTVTALATNCTIAAPTGTPANGNMLIIRIKDDGTARTIARNAIFRAVGVTLQTTTVANKTVYELAVYNSASSTWDIIASQIEA